MGSLAGSTWVLGSRILPPESRRLGSTSMFSAKDTFAPAAPLQFRTGFEIAAVEAVIVENAGRFRRPAADQGEKAREGVRWNRGEGVRIERSSLCERSQSAGGMGCDEIGHVERMHPIDADEQHMLVGCSCRLAGRKDGEGKTHHHAKQNAPAHH